MVAYVGNIGFLIPEKILKKESKITIQEVLVQDDGETCMLSAGSLTKQAKFEFLLKNKYKVFGLHPFGFPLSAHHFMNILNAHLATEVNGVQNIWRAHS